MNKLTSEVLSVDGTRVQMRYVQVLPYAGDVYAVTGEVRRVARVRRFVPSMWCKDNDMWFVTCFVEHMPLTEWCPYRGVIDPVQGYPA